MNEKQNRLFDYMNNFGKWAENPMRLYVFNNEVSLMEDPVVLEKIRGRGFELASSEVDVFGAGRYYTFRKVSP